MKRAVVLAAVILIGLVVVPGSGGRPAGRDGTPRPLSLRLASPAPAVPSASTPRAAAGYGRIPLQFVPNMGQAGGPADFYVQGRDKTLYFAPEGLTFVLNPPAEPAGRGGAEGDPPGGNRGISARGPRESWVVKLDFLDPNESVRPVGLEKSGSVISYFKGRPAEWKTGLAAYSRIAYRDLWPGIDLVYSGTFDRMKYEFVVRPGADPERIRLAYRGAQCVRLSPEGRLEVETPAGGFQDDIPVACQEIEGENVAVPVAYALEDPAPAGGTAVSYGFRIGEYDRGRTLVLDPAVLVHCGYIGGSGADAAHAVAVDAAGNAYIAGETSSTDLNVPDLAGPDLTYNGGDSDAFVAKLNPEGTALLYCGYIGGAGKDAAAGVGVDLEGCVYIAGTTDSTEATFPVQVGPDLTYNGGESDAFVAKLNPEGCALVFCGYIGGSGRDTASGIAWGQEGGFMSPLTSDIYIAGSTSSTEATFPVAVGPDLTYNGGESDAFVAKLKEGASGLEFCGYIGGAGVDAATALDVVVFLDGFGGIYDSVNITGFTSSTESSFPVAFGPDLTYNGGESDAFVATMNYNHDGLDYCGYVGGAGRDVGLDLLMGAFPVAGQSDPLFAIFITGYTSSTESTFPVAVGPDLTFNGGECDAFIASIKLGDEQPVLLSCGYIGGAGADAGIGIVPCGNEYFGCGVCVAGTTSSSESTFPAKNAADMTYNGGASDAFVAKLRLDPMEIASCGYIGGAGQDRAEALAVRGARDLYIAGTTDSSGATFPVSGGPDLSYKGGSSDAFAARVLLKGPAPASLSPSSANAGDPGFLLRVTGSDFLDGAHVRWQGRELATTFVSDTELRATVEAEHIAGGEYVDVTVENPDSEGSMPLRFEVRRPAPTLTSLSPNRASAGIDGLVLSLTGTNFLSEGSIFGWDPVVGNTVLWNGAEKGSYFINETELVVPLSYSDLAAGGEVQVQVINRPPSQGDSNVLVFTLSSFTMAPSPSTMTVTAGQSATCAIQLAPQFGSFDSPVTFDCTGLPEKCAASFSPATVTPGAAGAATTLTLKTTAPSTSAAGTAFGSSGPAPFAPAWLLLLLLAPLGASAVKAVHRGRPARWLAAAAAVLVLAILIAACSTSVDRTIPGTPRGTYPITIKATSGNLTVTNNVTLTVN